MRKRIYVSLTTKGSIDKAIKELETYQNEFHKKVALFKERLLEEVGVKTAYENAGEYGSYIIFEAKDTDAKVSFLVGKDGQKIVKEWYASKKNGLEHKNVRSYEISPLLMAEFGSGFLAKVLDDVSGVGQGTMPGQKHAFDPEGWAWYDENGIKHKSEGEAPTFPMHAASMAMLMEADRVAKEVFG